MQLSAAAAHLKALSSSALSPRRSVAKTDSASSVLTVVDSVCSDDSMSIDTCSSNASKAMTMMDVDPPRRRRDEADMSLDSDGQDCSRREVLEDCCGGVDAKSIDDVSMGDTVKASIGSGSGLNGRYWTDFVLEAARCESVLGMDINMPRRHFTRSRMKMAVRSESSCDASSTEDSQEFIAMDVGYEDFVDAEMEEVVQTWRIVEEDSDEEDSTAADDEDDDSIMSALTADGEGDMAFEGLDVRAVDVCGDRMGRLVIEEDLMAMEVDDDEGSIVIARYQIKTTEVLDNHLSRRYFTRGLARLLLKRTRSGLCY